MTDNIRRILFLIVIPSFLFPASAFLRGISYAEEGISKVKVAGIVLKWIPKEREKNYKRAEDLIRRAVLKGADIVCTAESFLDGYCIREPGLTKKEFHVLAEPIPEGKYFQRLKNLADELNIYIVAALTERDSINIFNSALLIDPSGILLGTYRKVFLYGNENNWYAKGDSFPVFETELGKIGMMICFDRQKSQVIEELAKNGAQLVFCPAGGGSGDWNDKIVSKRSKEGGVPIVFVHPNEFLVTGSSGEILESFLYGGELDESEKDPKNGVVRLYNLNITHKSHDH